MGILKIGLVLAFLFFNFYLQEAQGGNEEYYVTFIFKEGKIVTERIKDPLFGERDFEAQLNNPVIYKNDEFYIPLEFIIQDFGGRFVTIDEKKFLIVFQMGTPYEEKILGEIDENKIIFYGNKGIATGFMVRDQEIYLSEEFFTEILGINDTEKDPEKFKITLALAF
ncbi:MAG: hypothetical protein ACPLXB_01255 [Minisyncoccia bacterium]